MRFCTKMPAEGDAYDNKLVMVNDDLRAWVAAGRPALHPKQARALCRTAAYVCGRDPAEVITLAETIGDAFVLSQPAASPPSPSRVPSNPTSSRPTKSGRTAGNPPKGKKGKKLAKRLRRQIAGGAELAAADIPVLMADADPALQRMYLGLEPLEDKPVMLSSDLSGQAKIMANADSELRSIWLEQLTAGQPAGAPVALDGDYAIDPERLALHKQATQLAADEGLEYGAAAVRILDRQAGGVFS